MANIVIDNSNLQNIADAIRAKVGGSTTYKPREMASAIESIPTMINNPVTFTENGTYTAPSGTGYSPVTVNVNSAKPEETFTATPKITSQTIIPTEGKVFSGGTVGPIYQEINTSAEMDAVNIDANIGKMYKYTGTTDTKYTNGRLYIVEENRTSSGLDMNWSESAGRVTITMSPFTYYFINGVATNNTWTFSETGIADNSTINYGLTLTLTNVSIDGATPRTASFSRTCSITKTNGIITTLTMPTITWQDCIWTFSIVNGIGTCTITDSSHTFNTISSTSQSTGNGIELNQYGSSI